MIPIILTFILLAYDLASLAAAAALLYRKPASSSGFRPAAAWGSALFFLLCHLLLFSLATRHVFHQIPYAWFVGCLILILCSRWLNGRILFGRNNWRHYAVTAGIFAAAITLDWLS